MTATPANWRVRVQARATSSRSTARTTRRAPRGTRRWRSCRWPRRGGPPAAPTRSATNVAVPGVLTHGHLPENDHHGGGFAARTRAPAALPDGPRTTEVDVSGFLYGQGDLSLPDARAPAARRRARPAARVRQPRRRPRHLPHDHRLPAAVHRPDRDRVPARERRASSTPASSASARRRSPPAANRVTLVDAGRPSRPARTPTSAACTRSCGARSASRAEPVATSASSSRTPTPPRACSRSGPASAATA